jgi:uncharacterized protein (DUF983 family)
MKTCPHCAETDLQDDAKICKHCGKKVKGERSGCLTTIFMIGVVICVFAGFAYWPLWILAGVLLLVMIFDPD